MADPIVVCPYDPGWPALFETLRAPIAAALAGIVVEVIHVGSTAVPGLAAKPIIDLDAVVPDGALVPEAIARLAGIGYVHSGDQGIPGREAFEWPVATPRHHLYVVTHMNRAHRDHIDLRDYLRRHADVASWYAAHKLELADRFRDDRDGYTAAKAPLIEAILRRARHAP